MCRNSKFPEVVWESRVTDSQNFLQTQKGVKRRQALENSWMNILLTESSHGESMAGKVRRALLHVACSFQTMSTQQHPGYSPALEGITTNCKIPGMRRFVQQRYVGAVTERVKIAAWLEKAAYLKPSHLKVQISKSKVIIITPSPTIIVSDFFLQHSSQFHQHFADTVLGSVEDKKYVLPKRGP